MWLDYNFARFTPKHMVWHACRFFWSWLHQNNLMLVVIFIGVALIVPTQISPLEYLRQQAGRLLVVGITASYWIYRQLFDRDRAVSTHMGQDAGLSSAHGHRDTGCAEATLEPFRSQRTFPVIPTKPGKISAHPFYATNVHVHLRSRRGQALQQHRRTNAVWNPGQGTTAGL